MCHFDDGVQMRMSVAFKVEGIEWFMLQFRPFERDMRGFADEVVPRVRRLVG